MSWQCSCFSLGLFIISAMRLAGAQQLHEQGEELLHQPLFYLYYDLEESKEQRPPFFCWVAGNFTVTEAETACCEHATGKQGTLYMLTAAGAPQPIPWIYRNVYHTTFAELAAAPFREVLTYKFRYMTDLNIKDFFDPTVFEQKIASRYVVLKRFDEPLVAPINAYVRQPDSPLYRLGRCAGASFYYNRAIDDLKIIRAVIKRTTIRDPKKKVFTPGIIAKAQADSSFVAQIDWNHESTNWDFSLLLLKPAPSLLSTHSPSPTPPSPNTLASHRPTNSSTPILVLVTICGLACGAGTAKRIMKDNDEL